MDLVEEVKRYSGGQMEVQNEGEGYLFRGEIERIAVEGDELQVRFAWLAKGEGFPPLPERWVSSDRLDYSASLQIYSPSDIGDGRICLSSPIVGETVVLYPRISFNFFYQIHFSVLLPPMRKKN